MFEKFNLRTPMIIQAPMAGGITTPELVAVVSNAGGLGSFATGYLKIEDVVSNIQAIKKLTSKPFAVNVFIPPKNIVFDREMIRDYQIRLNGYRDQLGLKQEAVDTLPTLPEDNFSDIMDVLLAEDIKIVSFTFGILPEKIIKTFKSKGVYLIGTATSVEEAVALERAGIDAIVAQGAGAGGHRGNFITPFSEAMINTCALVSMIVVQVHCPVIAAGGIMDATSVANAIAAGAAAVQMGTAFLSVAESGANDVYKAQLEKATLSEQDPTAITSSYSGKPARAIKTQFMLEMADKNIPMYPIPHHMTQAIRKEAALQNKPEFMSLYCGSGIGMGETSKAAVELLEKIWNTF